MNVLHRLLVSCSLLLSCVSLQAYVKSVAVWELFPGKSPIRVLLMGDHHEACEMGKAHFDVVYDAVEQWGTRSGKVYFVLEDADWAKHNADYKNETLLDLGVFAYKNKKKYKKTSFVFGDKRGVMWNRLSWFYWDFLEPNSKDQADLAGISRHLLGEKSTDCKSLEEMDIRLSRVPHVWERFAAFENYVFNDHIHMLKFNTKASDLLEEIQHRIDLYKLYQSDFEEFSYISALIDQLQECFDAMSSMYKNPERPQIQLFLDEIKLKKSFYAGTQLYEDYFSAVGCLVAEIGFMIELLKLIKKSDKIAFLIGNHHAIELNAMFESFAQKGLAKKIKSEGVFDKKNTFRTALSTDVLQGVLQDSFV